MRKIFLLMVFTCLYACKKTIIEDVQGDSLRISILPVAELGLNAFRVTGSLEIRQTSGNISYGLLIGKSVNPTEGNAKSYTLGSSMASTDFVKDVKDLDTGSVYYVRAYAKRDNLIEYSANQMISKVSPQILRADTSLNYGRAFTIFTNISKLDPTADVQVFLDNKQITVKSITSGFLTTTITAEFNDSFKPGKMSLTLKIGDINIDFGKKVTLLEGLWKQLPDLPTSQSGFFVNTERILVGDWIYALGQSQQATPIFSKYNFITGQSVQLSVIPEGSVYQNGAILYVGNEIHFIGGEKRGAFTNVASSKVHFVYNILSDTWRKEQDFPGIERVGTLSFVVGDKIYFGLGIHPGSYSSSASQSDYLTDMWNYDPIKKIWKQLTDFPETKGRYREASFLIGSKIYFTGGVSKMQYTSVANKETWCYDVLVDKWSKKASFPSKAEVSFANFSINGKGYVGLGESSTYDSYYGRNLYQQVYRYDPGNDKWTEVGTAPEPAGSPFSAAYSNYAIMGAGSDNYGTAKTKFFVFYP